MPLIDQFILPEDITVLLWNPQESEAELITMFSPSASLMHRLTLTPTEKRRKEILTTHLLLDRLLDRPFEVLYSTNGRPYLRDEEIEISVSHTHNCVAVAMHSSLKLGMDVERIAPKVMRIKSKFMNDGELQQKDESDDLLYTLIIWSAKESLFKVIDIPGIDFREHLSIDRFLVEQQGRLLAQECKSEQEEYLPIFYKQYSQFVFTITWKKKFVE